MPFEKGNQLAKTSGGGRKGYEYEEEQLKKMREILDKALILTKKVMSGGASIREAMAYENSIRMVLKIMDKLHANRQTIDMTHEIKDYLTEEQVDEILKRRATKNTSSGQV